MPAYTYKVRDQSGKIVQGLMDAADGRELRKKLDEKDYFLIEFSEKKDRKSLQVEDFVLQARKVSLNDISVFSWQMYTMLDAGMTLTNALQVMDHQTRNPALKESLRDIQHRVEEGNSFSDALRRHPQVFSRLFVQMVNAGEVGGFLDEMLRRLARYYESQADIQSRIRSAMTYPAVLICVSLSVAVFLVMYILPQFANVFQTMGATVPLVTQTLLDVGQFLRRFWIILVFVPLGAVFLFGLYTQTEIGRYNSDQFKLSVPIFGDLMRKTIAARFTQTLATLISSGIPILTALEVVTDTVGNTVVARTLKKVYSRVGEGKSIAQPLGESRVFPEMVVSMIRVGEETGALDKMLEKVSHFYDREVYVAIQTFTKLLEPVLIVMMTLVIGFIAVSILLPMADVLQGMHGV